MFFCLQQNIFERIKDNISNEYVIYLFILSVSSQLSLVCLKHIDIQAKTPKQFLIQKNLF